jgi:hypothetical protein
MASIDDELSQIERDIRTLKIEFEQFFGGGRKRPPNDTQWRLESLLRRCGERIGDLTYGQRFRYNNLTQTYAKYQDMWRKKLAQKETGLQQRHFGAAAKAIDAARQRNRVSTSTAPARDTEKGRPTLGPSSDGVGDGAGERERIGELYRKLIEARREAGDQSGAPTLKDFERFVQQKTRDLQKKGAQQVEFAVAIEGGRVKLKARVEN